MNIVLIFEYCVIKFKYEEKEEDGCLVLLGNVVLLRKNLWYLYYLIGRI